MAEDAQADLVQIGGKQAKLTSEEGLTGSKYLIWQSTGEPGGS